MRVIEYRVARAVTHPVRSRLVNGERRRRPQIASRIIAQKNAVARRISHRIIVPRRDAVEEAVARPRRAASAFADDETRSRVADHVDPGCGRQIASVQMDLVFTLCIEAAKSVEALETRTRIRGFCVNRHRTEGYDVAIHDVQLGWISVFHSREFEEIAKAQPIAVHLHSRHCLEQSDFFGLQYVTAPNEDAAR